MDGDVAVVERIEPLARTLLARSALLEEEGLLDVACSGGPDSTALALLSAVSGRPVHLHHVDHGLRPTSSDEADVVAALATAIGADFTAHRVVVEPGPNLEERARLARRAVLPAEAATGHTMDDQAETVLLNLLRGTGPDGLGAMVPGRRHPILSIRRAEARQLVEMAQIAVVEDESNDDPRFVRNEVRARLLPLMAEISGRDPVPLLARLADLARADGALLDQLADEAIDDPSIVAALRDAPAPLADRALRAWLTAARGADGLAHPPTSAELARVRAVVDGHDRATELHGGVRVARTEGRLRVEATRTGTLRRVSDASDELSAPAWASHDLGEVIVSGDALRARIQELGAAITADYRDNPPLLVGVLKGAILFMADLARAIELPCEMDFMAVSSYGSATKTSGIVRIVKDLDLDLTGRHVLVVEDIVDSGLTLNYLRKYLGARKPASIEVCALLLKKGEQRIEQDLRYVGFTIPSSFVVGYGLDVAERYRNLDGIYAYVGEGSD